MQPEVLAKELKSPPRVKNGSKIIYFPNEKGELVPFKVSEASVLSPELAAKYPQIKSYVGHSLMNKDRIRFSVSHNGVQSMVVHAGTKSTTFMQKVSKEGNTYVVYNRDSEILTDDNFICDTKSTIEKSASGPTSKLVDDQLLRKFRVAISASGEYTQYHGGTVADALGAINATITRINEVFETDLGVTLELVPNNDLLIFTDSITDPYNGNLNSEVQNILTSTIGEENYDVGHLFHKDSNNGNAGFVGSVCVDNRKGSAYSSGLNPEGDRYDMDYVAHEMGHQFGANHTWSYESEGTLVQAEPGSGTTIMGYAGIAGINDVAPFGDDYFHYYSIFQVSEYLGTVSCAELIPITNNPPVITPVGNFVVPKSTAFVLTGNVTDPDTGDVLTYAWEQIDDGVVTATTFGPTNPSGANFRSQKPSTVPERYFPKLSRILQGNLTQINPVVNSAWETVSNVEREMNFALSVRDNASGGGQVVSDLVNVRVVNNSGPFAVTSQTTNETYVAGTVQRVTWDVANTDKAPVNAQTVDIFLSTDGGLTFPVLLAGDVPNDGVHEVLMPGVSTTGARLMVKANDNIFFAVNSASFTIEPSEVVLHFTDVAYEVCQPDDILATFNYETYLGFNEEVTFTTSGAPVGLGVSFSPTTATATNTPVSITFSGTENVTAGNYPVTVTATSASLTKEVTIDLNIYGNTFSDVPLSSPADGLLDASIGQLFQWEANPSYTSYDIEIATDTGFIDIVESATVIFNSYLSSNLGEETTYYWRVKPRNNCGEGTFGTPFSFTTTTVTCNSKTASDLPLAISSIGTPTVVSKISFLDDLPIADVNVNLDITHTYLADLVVRLTSPSGTTVVLISNSCGDSRNINATFDDGGTGFVCGSDPGISGTVKPLGSLASFNGESTLGEWILQIDDTAAADGGTLNAFSLDICAEGVFRPDADKDGVFDDGDDLCLGTPKGVEVNTDGCPVYRFPADNFSVAIQSESCRNNNDGAIQITVADETIDYTVSVSGNGADTSMDFTSSYVLEDLMAGRYNVCITGTDGTIVYEEYCFETVIHEPEPLGVSSKMSVGNKQVILAMTGASLYNIELNGVLIQTEKLEITLDLKNGTNILKVYTNLSCQGTYEEQFFVSGKPIIYPNPLLDRAKAFLGADVKEIEVAVYASNGQPVSTKTYAVNGGEIELDFTGLPSGIYFISFNGKNVKGTYKVIKR